MNVLRLWLVQPKHHTDRIRVISTRADVEQWEGRGHAVTGPFVLEAEQQAAGDVKLRRALERIRHLPYERGEQDRSLTHAVEIADTAIRATGGQ